MRISLPKQRINRLKQLISSETAESLLFPHHHLLEFLYFLLLCLDAPGEETDLLFDFLVFLHQMDLFILDLPSLLSQTGFLRSNFLLEIFRLLESFFDLLVDSQ